MKRLLLVCLLAIAVGGAHPVAAGGLSARGLDLFVQAPTSVRAGMPVPLQVRAYGFPTIATPVPLPGATVEAAWDPESVKDALTLPKPVSLTVDKNGRGHLEIASPPGKGSAKLLLSIRHDGRQRTRDITIQRNDRYQLDLRTSDTHVVPGGKFSAWLTVMDLATGRGASGCQVDVALKDGDSTVFSRRLRTDTAGMSSVDIPVPSTRDPEWTWNLFASIPDDASHALTLSAREEIPQSPSMHARFDPTQAEPGASAVAVVDLLDGTGAPIRGQAVRYLVLQKGMKVPKEDKEWIALSIAGKTDVDGRLRVPVETPRTVSPKGSYVQIIAKTDVEGLPLSAEATLPLSAPTPAIALVPEFGVLLPGLSQRLLVHATFEGKPLSVDVALEGHGLAAKAKTNERGLAAVQWKVPEGIGALFPHGGEAGCAGEVAATVQTRLISPPPGMAAVAPIKTCLRVDRDAVAIVRPDRQMVRAGESLTARILGKAAGGASVVLESADGNTWKAAWIPDARKGGPVAVPETAQATHVLGAVGLPDGKVALTGNLLVVPKILPKLEATLAFPGNARGEALVEAMLTDGKGHPLPGVVGAVVFDKAGGGSAESLVDWDTRRHLVAGFGLDDKDVDPFLDGDPRFDLDRLLAMSSPRSTTTTTAAQLDPTRSAREGLGEIFKQIVKSLEGGIYQAATRDNGLRDVLVKAQNGNQLNPEMLTLATDAMSEPPVTPGGEPWMLSDLMAIDKQVSYDLVAARVARLKIFRVLKILRDHVFEERVDRDEPLMRQPEALIRHLVRDEKLQEDDLVDPWGHTLRFVKHTGPHIPFLDMFPGKRLVSAGPDGRFGTRDDVVTPFQRVLKSKTPYADAVEEDRLVDSQWDMRVADETVDAWDGLFKDLTGTVLGEAYGVGGLGTIGTGGGGSGFGRGSGGLGGRRARMASTSGFSAWIAPVRVDEHGRVRLPVPLGDAETTWRIVLVAMSDVGLPATASVEANTELPLSLHVDAGDAWIEGDEVDVAIQVRNRGDAPVHAEVRVRPSGAAVLPIPAQGKQTVDVPAGGLRVLATRVRAKGPGTGVLDVEVEGAGKKDRLRREWTIARAGEELVVARSILVDGAGTLAVPTGEATVQPMAAGTLVLERGITPIVAGIVESVAPDRLTGTTAFADAAEILARVQAWTTANLPANHALAARVRELGPLVLSRAERMGHLKTDKANPDMSRLALWSDRGAKQASSDQCPPAKQVTGADRIAWLRLATATPRTELACFATLRAAFLNALSSEEDPGKLAEGLLYFLDQPGQGFAVETLAARLAERAPTRTDGTLGLPEYAIDDRGLRTTVLLALARAGKASPETAKRETLWARALAERDAGGGYGSTSASLHMVKALLSQGGVSAPVTVEVDEFAANGSLWLRHAERLEPESHQQFALSEKTTHVRVRGPSPGVLATIRRPFVRSYFHPVHPADSPLRIDLALPTPPIAGGVTNVQLAMRGQLPRATPVRARVPLPPGVRLAAKVDQVRQIQGALYIQTTLEAGGAMRVFALPMRFGLPGKVTWPEATVRAIDREVPPGRSPAHSLTIAGAR